MSHLLYSKRGHDSEDDDSEYTHSDVTIDDDYTDEEETEEDDYTDDDEEDNKEEESEQGPEVKEEPELKEEPVVVTKEKEPVTTVVKEEPVKEQIQYSEIDPEEAKEKRIQEHRDYRRKLAEDPSFVPYVGLFWGHDDRYRDDAFTETRAVSENIPHFNSNTSKSTSIKQGEYDKSLDPLMYKKWDHSGWEELLRLDEEDERRRQALIAAGELRENEGYKPNRNSHYQNSSRDRGYRQRGNYHNQGQHYHNQGQNYNNRPRYQNHNQQQNRQQEWPALPTKPVSQEKENVTTNNDSSQSWEQVDSVTTQPEKDREHVESVTVQIWNDWGHVDFNTAQTDAIQISDEGWGQVEFTVAPVDTVQANDNGWGQVEPVSAPTNATQTNTVQPNTVHTNDNGWGKKSNTAEIDNTHTSNNGWGQVDSSTAQTDTVQTNNTGWEHVEPTVDAETKTTHTSNNGWGEQSTTVTDNQINWATESKPENNQEQNIDWTATETIENSWNDTSKTDWATSTEDNTKISDYRTRRLNNSRFIPAEEKASSSWANSDLSKTESGNGQYTQDRSCFPRNNFNNRGQDRRNNYRSNDYQRNGSYQKNSYQRNRYQKDETKASWDTSVASESQGWANTSTPTNADDNTYAASSNETTLKKDSWNASEAPTTVKQSWDTIPQETTTQNNSWDVSSSEPVVEKSTGWDASSSNMEVIDSWKAQTTVPVPEKAPSPSVTKSSTEENSWGAAPETSNSDSWGVPSKDSVAASWDAPVKSPVVNNESPMVAKSENWSKPDWSEPAVKTLGIREEVPSAKPTGWSSIQTSNDTSSGLAPSKDKETNSWSIPKQKKWEEPKQESASSWNQAGWDEGKTTTRKSRGYLSQKMDNAPEVPVIEEVKVVEEVVVQPNVAEPESSTWSTFRNYNDEDSDVEIILEAEEEPDWLKGEQVLGMTAPYDASKDSARGKSSPKTTKNNNYHSYDSSPRSDGNRKTKGRKPRRNFEENWRVRDDNEDLYRHTPPTMYYQPHQMNAFVPMIPNANGNSMYAVSFPMGASTGGSVSPNHESDDSSHQKYYTSPPMMNPSNMQLPPGYEANGMVYYGMDPNVMYQPQPFYYYVPMHGAADAASPLMYANEGSPNEDDGWGPSPNVSEEQWSKSSPANDKNRNPHSMPYNPSYYYYQNPY
jgi:hypothetical protein